MITFPNCKINLGLWVTDRRPDGYHTIQTVMFPVRWCDILEIVPASGKTAKLTVSGMDVTGKPEENLCYKAWKLMSDLYSIPAVAIHLHKIIPTGAGLGGGSVDASFMLRMLNTMFQLRLNDDILRSLSAQLGMDCPFFIDNVPALSTGRGDILQAVTINLDGFYLVVVKPPVHINTATAFAGISPVFRDDSIVKILGSPVQEWKNTLVNDFEKTIFARYPQIGEIKEILYRRGAVYAAMSGSGSAVYGLFSEKPAVDFPGCEVFQTLLGSQP